MKKSKRLPWIDAARGLAIFGIFMVNMPSFNAPYFLFGGEEAWTGDLNRSVQAGIDLFFQASFYTLFSFLFGFGLYMMKESLEEKRLLYSKVLIRRLSVLIVFGLIHGILIWYGDILLTYGVLGFLLLPLLRSSVKAMAWWALTILLVFTSYVTYGYYSFRDQLGEANQFLINKAFAAYQSDNLLTIWTENWETWQLVYASVYQWVFLAASIFPVMVFGVIAAKKRWLHEPWKHSAVLKRIGVISFLLFVLFKMGPYVYGNPEWFSTAQDNIGGTASAIFYMTMITLLFNKREKLFIPFQYVGKLSLSNYIFQSVLCFVLFYGVGFGLYGGVSPAWSVVLVVIIYAFQVVGSYVWLKFFRYGLLEWIWRIFTYRQVQPLKKS
ncbi:MULTISPECIES: DUF418 domain-containing protein [Pontibacillus]|uniref:DUF418 domain-containing protein n=1 Tax=Pontibacillus chungwhensis TaxID=265426 RepID=A0ABY8V547_9BACI|nr:MULTISPECIES: DUF418 domain-containing protein [Pontibacillus]MCD5325014.1 DUF418 domain-containing protein [Pontibacillus sp. HN14]WIF98966.1 DUF418 domain-containing protein [Pontibacillus chungwhensis]